MMRPALLLVACALLALPGSAMASDEAEKPASLRVLTYNVWGVPGVSDHRAARIARIGPAVAGLAPDVVLLQEAWTTEDASTLREALRAAGLVHQEGRATDGPIAYKSTGLLVASRLPLENVKWVDYSGGRLPHTPYHVDWMAQKSALIFTVKAAPGPITIATTHMQASYATGRYEPVRLAQTLQLIDGLVAAGELGAPLLVAGDLNYEAGELGERVLREGLGLRTIFSDVVRDGMFYRGGSQLRVDVRSASKALTEPVDLGNGARTPLSDHPALVIDLELAAGAPNEPQGRTLEATAPAVDREIEDELTLTRTQRGGALAVLVLGFVAASRALRRTRRPRVWALALLPVAVYAVYFALGYGLAHEQAMEQARANLYKLRGQPAP